MSSTSHLLRVVDSLVITVLVDNSIEWMTKLPPGFSHEIASHLADGSSTVDEVTGVPVLDFEHFCCGAHGFSALIETQINGEGSHLTLFDTGPDSQSIVRNINAMKVPINAIGRVVLSHWHSDHSGGILSFLKLRANNLTPSTGPCVIDLHPDRPTARGIAPPPKYNRVLCALPSDPEFDSIEEAGGIVEKHAEGHVVVDGTIWVSGEIPRLTPYEAGILGGVRWITERNGEQVSGEWIKEEHIMDERYVAIDVAGKGLVVFSACSHAGIVNVVMDAIKQFARPIYMIIGGLHLAGPELAPRIPLTVDFLARKLTPSPTYILPMHCTGFNAKVSLEHAFGEGCVPAGVGLKITIKGDREYDHRLFPPVY